MERRSAAVTALCLAEFVDVLGVTIVVTALPSVLDALGGSTAQAGLVVTGYAMCFGGLLLLGARLGDRFGPRRMLLAGLVLFAVAAVPAALGSSMAVLVVARCVQG